MWLVQCSVGTCWSSKNQLQSEAPSEKPTSYQAFTFHRSTCFWFWCTNCPCEWKSQATRRVAAVYACVTRVCFLRRARLQTAAWPGRWCCSPSGSRLTLKVSADSVPGRPGLLSASSWRDCHSLEHLEPPSQYIFTYFWVHIIGNYLFLENLSIREKYFLLDTQHWLCTLSHFFPTGWICNWRWLVLQNSLLPTFSPLENVS